MDHCTGAAASGDLMGFMRLHRSMVLHRANGIYVIRFRNTMDGPRHARFIRGYGYQGGAGPQFDFNAEGFGGGYKQAVVAGTMVSRSALSENVLRGMTISCRSILN